MNVEMNHFAFCLKIYFLSSDFKVSLRSDRAVQLHPRKCVILRSGVTRDAAPPIVDASVHQSRY